MATWKNAVPNRHRLHQLKREALLREAVSAFNQKGFHATTLDDIAATLGVTKAALYYYFPNKHALLFECFSEALRVAFMALKSARENGTTGLEKLQLTIEAYLTVALGELSQCVILTEEHALLPEHREVIFKQRDEFEGALRDFVREGMEDGSVIPCDPRLAIFSIYGAVNWVPKWFSHKGKWRAEQLASAMSELLCRSIARHPSAALTTDVAAMVMDIQSGRMVATTGA